MDSIVGDHILPDSKWSYFLQEEPDIAYVRISIFGERTAEEFREVLKKIKPQAKALIIDLRFNPGGVLSAGGRMCDMLLSEGRIVSTRVASPLLTIRKRPIVMWNCQRTFRSSSCRTISRPVPVKSCRLVCKITSERWSLVSDLSVKVPCSKFLRSIMRARDQVHHCPLLPSQRRQYSSHAELKPEDVWGVLPEKELEQKPGTRAAIPHSRWQQQGDPRRIKGPQPPSPAFLRRPPTYAAQ